MDREEFISRFGGVFEKSSWIAEVAWGQGIEPQDIDLDTIYRAMVSTFRGAGAERQISVLRSHPDLAGRLALAGNLTPDSLAEQSSAGLDKCSEAELSEFKCLNNKYVEKFKFPFIIAVRGLNRQEILKIFRSRIDNSRESEFKEATKQAEKIAFLRLQEIFSDD